VTDNLRETCFNCFLKNSVPLPWTSSWLPKGTVAVFDRSGNIRSYAAETPDGLPEHVGGLPVIGFYFSPNSPKIAFSPFLPPLRLRTFFPQRTASAEKVQLCSQARLSRLISSLGWHLSPHGSSKGLHFFYLLSQRVAPEQLMRWRLLWTAASFLSRPLYIPGALGMEHRCNGDCKSRSCITTMASHFV